MADLSIMNIAQLKKLLSEISNEIGDDYQVWLSSDEEGNEFLPMSHNPEFCLATESDTKQIILVTKIYKYTFIIILFPFMNNNNYGFVFNYIKIIDDKFIKTYKNQYGKTKIIAGTNSRMFSQNTPKIRLLILSFTTTEKLF